MDDDGKIDGRYPVFSDVLAFLWCKMKVCTKDTLIDVMSAYYNHDDVVKARDLLYLKVDGEDGRRTKHRKKLDMLGALYDVMQEIPTERALVFLALDLNHIPCVDLKNVDAVTLVCQQNVMKREMEDVKNEQAAMREQILEITKLLESKSNAEGAQGPYAVALKSQVSQHPLVPSLAAMSPSQRVNTTRSTDAPIHDRRPEVDAPSRPPASGAASGGEERVPRGYVRDTEGFLSRAQQPRRQQRTFITGQKTGTMIRAAARKLRMFVTRPAPSVSVESLKEFILELTGAECEIEKLHTKGPDYASFVISCNKEHEATVMNPDEWEEGVLLRHFYGKLPSEKMLSNGQTTS